MISLLTWSHHSRVFKILRWLTICKFLWSSPCFLLRSLYSFPCTLCPSNIKLSALPLKKSLSLFIRPWIFPESFSRLHAWFTEEPLSTPEESGSLQDLEGPIMSGVLSPQQNFLATSLHPNHIKCRTSTVLCHPLVEAFPSSKSDIVYGIEGKLKGSEKDDFKKRK